MSQAGPDGDGDAVNGTAATHPPEPPLNMTGLRSCSTISEGEWGDDDDREDEPRIERSRRQSIQPQHLLGDSSSRSAPSTRRSLSLGETQQPSVSSLANGRQHFGFSEISWANWREPPPPRAIARSTGRGARIHDQLDQQNLARQRRLAELEKSERSGSARPDATTAGDAPPPATEAAAAGDAAGAAAKKRKSKAHGLLGIDVELNRVEGGDAAAPVPGRPGRARWQVSLFAALALVGLLLNVSSSAAITGIAYGTCRRNQDSMYDLSKETIDGMAHDIHAETIERLGQVRASARVS